jgi:hypothetical protein
MGLLLSVRWSKGYLITSRDFKYGILRPCQSAWNTPLLPFQKPDTNDYYSVQDFWAFYQTAVALHPMVPNPYTLLTWYQLRQPASRAWT